MAVNKSLDVRAFERRFYLFLAAAFPLVVVTGFARTYYLRGFFDAPPVPSMLVHMHGLVMSSWVILFIAQVWLVRSRNVRLHRIIGYFGIGLAVVIVAVGYFTALVAARFGSPSTPPGVPPRAFLAVPLGDLLVFALLFAAAVYYRRRPANHKRLMFLTVINFLPPALGRMTFLQPAGAVAFFGIPAAIAIGALVYDTYRCGRLNRVFLIATTLVVVAFPLRIVVATSDLWMKFAMWLTA